jgi:predicted transcriptional regulator
METKPTPSELEILQVLWRRGPSSVREVHAEINTVKQNGYTTVLKLMQIMAEKGLVQRDENNRAHVYTATFGRTDTQTTLVDDLAQRVFEGSAFKLALHALGSKKATPDELAEMRRLLEEMEKP